MCVNLESKNVKRIKITCNINLKLKGLSIGKLQILSNKVTTCIKM